MDKESEIEMKMVSVDDIREEAEYLNKMREEGKNFEAIYSSEEAKKFEVGCIDPHKEQESFERSYILNMISKYEAILKKVFRPTDRDLNSITESIKFFKLLDMYRDLYSKYSGDVSSSNLSYIEPHEEKEAKEFVEKHLGFPAPRPTGYHMYVKIYVREEDVHIMTDNDGNPLLDQDGKPKYIALPSSVTANDKFKNCTALVVSMGPDCYKGERFKHSGPWCKVGDWVVIPRNEGIQVSYRKVAMQIIPDDRILSVIEDPTYVTRD